MITNGVNRSLVAAGMLLGIGLGGFFDGITFHQILQVHNMMSAVKPNESIVNLEINMFWDGLFHAVCWIFTITGVAALFSAAKQREESWEGRTLAGGMLIGWGLFNLVEGVIDHHVLHLHHVVERLGVSVWDYAFLASGVILMAGGIAIIRRGARGTEAPRRRVTLGSRRQAAAG